MLKKGDYVKVKKNTMLDTGDIVSDWAGKVKMVYPKEKTCLITLDAQTINLLENSYIKVAVDGGTNAAEYGFEFKELELSTRRDTAKEAAIALSNLNGRISVLGDDEEEEEQEKLKVKWIEAFCKSTYFNKLSGYQKEHAAFIIDTFMGYMYNYEDVKPAEWDAASLVGVCLDTIPRKVSAEIALFENYGDVLISFFSFLHHKSYIKNGKKLIKAIKNIKDEIPLAANDSSSWGIAKSMLMLAESEGVDMTNERALQQFFMNINLR